MCFEKIVAVIFQSTPSVGRATSFPLTSNPVTSFQSTPSVGRATWKPPVERAFIRYFNPRPPWGGRRWDAENHTLTGGISIHALRGEGDIQTAINLSSNRISIHALRGEGDYPRSSTPNSRPPFQSTPSVGRATSLS